MGPSCPDPLTHALTGPPHFPHDIFDLLTSLSRGCAGARDFRNNSPRPSAAEKVSQIQLGNKALRRFACQCRRSRSSQGRPVRPRSFLARRFDGHASMRACSHRFTTRPRLRQRPSQPGRTLGFCGENAVDIFAARISSDAASGNDTGIVRSYGSLGPDRNRCTGFPMNALATGRADGASCYARVFLRQRARGLAI